MVSNINEGARTGLSRRGVVKAAALSLPLAAVAFSATPASAAGTSVDVDLLPVFRAPVAVDLREDIIAGLIELRDSYTGFAIRAAFNALIEAIRLAGTAVFNVTLDFPEALDIINCGLGWLGIGVDIDIDIDFDTDLLRVEDTVAGVFILETNNDGAHATTTTTAATAPNQVAASAPIRYNPLVVQLTTGSKHTELGNVTATITNSDTNAANNTVTAPVGLNVEVGHAVSAAIQVVKDLLGVPDLFVPIRVLT